MSRRGHVPIRMCLGCRKRKKKEDLVRLTRGAEGSLIVSEKGHLEGRGFYLCPELGCLRKAQKKYPLRWAFGTDGGPFPIQARVAEEMEERARRSENGED